MRAGRYFVDLDVEGDFDIDGVKLYPGSKVTSVNVDASDRNGADKATVQLGFTSPATPAKAADWMAGEFAKKGTKVARTGDVLAGLCAARLAVGGDPYQAACEAVWLHGEAARRAGAAFVADDLIAHIPAALVTCL